MVEEEFLRISVVLERLVVVEMVAGEVCEDTTCKGQTTNSLLVDAVNSALASGMYAAQVGVFSKKANVEALVSVLNSKGFKTISQNININGKAMIRVFAGTSKTREGALAICNKVKKNTKEQCRIVAL